MTMESYQQLDTRITGLSSQLVAQQHKSNAQFESIMQSLQLLQHKTIPQPDQAMESIHEAGGSAFNSAKPFSGKGS